MTERKAKFINYWAVIDMIDRRYEVLDAAGIEHGYDTKAFSFDDVMVIFLDIKHELNEEWHREIEEYFEE